MINSLIDAFITIFSILAFVAVYKKSQNLVSLISLTNAVLLVKFIYKKIIPLMHDKFLKLKIKFNPPATKKALEQLAREKALALTLEIPTYIRNGGVSKL